MDSSRISIDFVQFSRPLKAPFRSAKQEFSSREGFLLRLTSPSKQAYGEASPLPGNSRESLDEVCAFLQQTSTLHLFSLWEDSNSSLLPSLRMAMDSAILELKAMPLTNPVRSNAVLGLGERAEARIADLWGRGFRTFKLKVGPSSTVECLQSLETLRAQAKLSGETYSVRLDSNHSFHPSEIVDFASGLAAYPIEYWEDPIPIEDRWAWKYFRKESNFPIAIDEACFSLPALDDLLAENLADFFILKPTILGGLQATEKAIRKILAKGRKHRITTAFETEVGVGGILRFLGTHGSPSLVHGLATNEFFADSYFPTLAAYSEVPEISPAGKEWLASLDWTRLC